MVKYNYNLEDYLTLLNCEQGLNKEKKSLELENSTEYDKLCNFSVQLIGYIH